MNPALDGFSLCDCYTILKKKLKTSDVEVSSYKFCPLSERKGFLGDYYHLRLNYSYQGKDESSRFFVKVTSPLEIKQQHLKENQLFIKECHFFQKLMSDFLESGIDIINDIVPVCYKVSEEEYLIFDDLAKEGYANLSARICPSLECVKFGLDALAKLHCTGLIYEEKMKEERGQNFKLTDKYLNLFDESFFPHTQMSNSFVESLKKGAETQWKLCNTVHKSELERFKKLANDVFSSFYEILRPSATYRNTILHGDLWATNFMYKLQNERPIHTYIIDFQTFRYGPPAQDFMSYLYLSTDRKFRQEHMEALIGYYHEKMSEIFKQYNLSIERILPYDEFVESCNYYKVYACAIALNHLQLVLIPPEELKTMFDVGSMHKATYEDRSEMVRDFFNKDDLYRAKMYETTIDLRNAFIENKQLQPGNLNDAKNV